MSKAQTDIRSTSYDATTANPHGYVGTINDALMQIRAESIPFEWFSRAKSRVRADLLRYLGVDKILSAGASVELDENPRYGDEPKAEEPSFYSLAYALAHFPGSFLHRDTSARLEALSDSQLLIFRAARERLFNVNESLAYAEGYPYSAVQS